MAPQLLTPEEVADQLRVTPQTVTRYIREGALPAVRLSAGYRITDTALATFLGQPLPVRPAARILAVAHHAGGVGKTTTTVNLAYSLARLGQRVLVVDLDPQGDLSERLGLVPGKPNLAEALIARQPLSPEIVLVAWGEISLATIPSNLGIMSDVEMTLAGVMNGRERRLQAILDPLRPAYDFILLDCPPSLSLLTTNALYAADGVLITMQAQDKAYRHLEKVIQTVEEINRYRTNAPLAVFGLLVTMVDKQKGQMAGEVEAAVRADYGDLVFTATIPMRGDAAMDGRHQAPLGVYAARNAAADAHMALAQEVIARAH